NTNKHTQTYSVCVCVCVCCVTDMKGFLGLCLKCFQKHQSLPWRTFQRSIVWSWRLLTALSQHRGYMQREREKELEREREREKGEKRERGRKVGDREWGNERKRE